MARGVEEPGEAGRHEVLVLLGLQHVERLVVGEGGVVDELDAVAHALLDGVRGARVGGELLVAAARLAHRHRDFLFRHRRLLGARSEEHTSELQSLMRISYAVFCLKKKNNKNTEHNNRKN